MDAVRERELPYAWVIVGLTFFALAVATGIRSTIGLLVHPWEVEFGWDRAAVSLTASFGFLVYGLAQPVAGRWADRYGPRLVFAGSLALLGVSTVAVGLVRTPSSRPGFETERSGSRRPDFSFHLPPTPRPACGVTLAVAPASTRRWSIPSGSIAAHAPALTYSSRENGRGAEPLAIRCPRGLCLT